MTARISFASFLLLVLVSGSMLAATTRRPLDEPTPISPDLRAQLSPDYARAVEEAIELGRMLGDGRATSLAGSLLETMDQAQLRGDVKRLLDLSQLQITQHKASQGQGFSTWNRLHSLALHLLDLIERGSYANDSPLQVDVDLRRRAYVVKWRDWSGAAFAGPMKTRTIPFPPRLTVRVAAQVKRTAGRLSYGYVIANSDESSAAAGPLTIEASGLTHERLAALSQLNWTFPSATGQTGYVRIFPPEEGILQDFSIYSYDNNEKRRQAAPGSQLRLPPVLSVPWPTLPGIVHCWIKADGYELGNYFSAELDPSTLQDVFFRFTFIDTPETGRKAIPKFEYLGKTLGPVPLPGPEVHRAQFLSTLIADLEVALHWGWVANPEITRTFQQALRDLQLAPGGPVDVEPILRSLAAARQKGDVLEETVILLTENLRYLADPTHWVEGSSTGSR